MFLLLFTWALVPETKGVTLEHIECKLMDGASLRDIGACAPAHGGSRGFGRRSASNRAAVADSDP